MVVQGCCYLSGSDLSQDDYIANASLLHVIHTVGMPSDAEQLSRSTCAVKILPQACQMKKLVRGTVHLRCQSSLLSSGLLNSSDMYLQIAIARAVYQNAKTSCRHWHLGLNDNNFSCTCLTTASCSSLQRPIRRLHQNRRSHTVYSSSAAMTDATLLFTCRQ